jgi:putative aldouronate transport system permease protein
MLPTISFFCIFAYVPLVGLYYAFINFNFIGGLFGSPFVGLKNFEFLFMGGLNAVAWKLTLNTVLYNLAFIFIGNGLQCFTAIILNDIPGKLYKRTTQSVMLLPYFVSYVIVGAIAYSIFNNEMGSLNNLLHVLGIKPVNVYMMPPVWKYILVFFYNWKNVGYGTIIYLAAIMGISRELYESAGLDGCNIFQQIRYITLPLLKPTFIMLVLFSLGGIMRGQFDLFFQMIGNNGLLFNATDILDTYIYRSLIINFNVSTGTAAGLYQSLFGFGAVMIVNAIIRKVNSENALF